MGYMQAYKEWIKNDYFDKTTKKELLEIQDDEREIQDRFYKDLEFGTGGLRGIIGAGTNRINVYTIQKATQGLANYILKSQEEGKQGVAIAYDSRFKSAEFAEEAALVLNGNGIPTYLFDSLRPTPTLSFALRELGCMAGIVITASHNPPEYNGYKVYWSDGGQVPPPKDEEIIQEVNQVQDYSQVKVIKKGDAIKAGYFHIIDSEIDDKYLEAVKAQCLQPEMIKKYGKDLTIVYTPLHGTGNIPVRQVLKEVGFENVWVVPEQEMPDSKFSTVAYPNPEDPKAFSLAIALAKEKDADIIIGTDPDADRLGVLVKDGEGEYVLLNGNITGILLMEYILSQKKDAGELPSNGAVISTVVSTKMSQAIANDYGITRMEVLTGFKFIGEKIKEFEKKGNYTFLFGFEESYGYLAGTHARDKDAVVAALLACELAAYYYSQGITPYEGIHALYEKYGYYKEDLHSITLKGIEGMEQIQAILEGFRNNPPTNFIGQNIVEIRDYDAQITYYPKTGVKTPITLPKSNVLYFVLEDESWFCVRPSGTEPKVKFYFGVLERSEREADEKLKALCKEVLDKINTMIA
ncbi:MAG: phospho-sugar mutase [Epulopiscium sp.]|nr:phospho-sugar mutase [Candidatus Epulonipiscium sp.]